MRDDRPTEEALKKAYFLYNYTTAHGRARRWILTRGALTRKRTVEVDYSLEV